ncbi:MAG: hypothetical protein ACQET7_01230 [Thermodesulfobacteriota bacterium]
METPAPAPDDLDIRKISLLQDLVDCLGKERESLLEINVTGLWAVMEEKQAILEAIEELPAAAYSTPPPLRSEIDRLKEEIRHRTRENTEFTRSSLAVFDEFISRITGTGRDDQTYRPPGEEHRVQRSPIYRRKV